MILIYANGYMIMRWDNIVLRRKDMGNQWIIYLESQEDIARTHAHLDTSHRSTS